MARNTTPRSRVSINHLKPIDFRTLAQDVAERDQWLVDPLIPAHRSISIVAKGGIGKSFLMLEIGAALATGKAILGQPAGTPMPVVYIDMEMSPDDLAERLTSLGYDYERDKKLRRNLHYYQLQEFKPFDTRLGGLQLCQISRLHSAQLVVIDTLARVVGGDENSADTYRAFDAHTCRPLKAEGRTLVRLDHLGKDAAKGARGSSAKGDDVDVAWTLSPRGGSENALRLVCTKRRIGWIPRQVDLVRGVSPNTHHVLAGGELSDKARHLVEVLADQHIPNDFGRGKVRDTLRARGVQASNEDVNAAISFRKQRSGQLSGHDSWKATGQGTGTGRSRNA